MLSAFIGPVDANAAAVLITIALAVCVIVTSMIVKRRSRLVLTQEFELAKIKQHDESAARMAALATDRDYKFKQLDQNLITSHRQD